MRRLLFKLDQNPKGLGLRCDSGGLFLGGDALLERDRHGNFEARPASDLQKVLGRVYGDETNWENRIRSVKLVANALNKGDMARAMMTAVLMRLPDRDGAIRIADVDGVLAKAGFNPDEPRDERGRWTNGGNGNDDAELAGHTARVQLADAGFSDASDDPVAQAASRAAAVAQHNHGNGASRDKPVNRERGNARQTLGSKLSDNADTLLSEIGRAQLEESNVDRAVAETKAIAEAYDAYNRWMEQPGGGSVPITPEFPIWGYGDNARLAPERPITRGDAISAAGAILSILPFGEGASVAAEVPEGASFIVFPAELPKSFDVRLPIGRYIIPTDAPPGTAPYGINVEKQIGDLFQQSAKDVAFTFNRTPLKGVDISVPASKSGLVGFRFAEIKPLSNAGFSRFKRQVTRWNLSAPVELITYDYEGSIYFGFPR